MDSNWNNHKEMTLVSRVPATILSIEDATRGLGYEVKEMESRWMSPRFQGKSRPYTAYMIATKRSRIRTPYLGGLMADKLWDSLQRHKREGTALLTFGAVDTIQGIHAARHLDALLVSASHASMASAHPAEPSPNLADYPTSTVPLQVEHLVRTLEFYDRKQQELACDDTFGEAGMRTKERFDYLKPIIADIDAGHGGLTTVMRMTRMLIERGAAGIQIEDQASGSHSSSKLHGQVLVPVSEHINRLVGMRMQADMMGCDTVIISRTDSNVAKLITGDQDKRDHRFILGATQPLHRLVQILDQAANFGATEEKLMEVEREWLIEAKMKTFPDAIVDAMPEGSDSLAQDWRSRCTTLSLDEMKQLASAMGFEIYWSAEHCRTQDGHYRYQGGLDAAISRARAFAPYSDIIGLESLSPDYDDAEKFSSQVRESCPNAIFTFDYATSYNWDARGLSAEGLRDAHLALARLGFHLQTIKSAGIMQDALMADLFSKDFAQRGILAYVDRVQLPEKVMNKDAILLHHVTGAEYYNRVSQSVLHRLRRNPLIMDSQDLTAIQALSVHPRQFSGFIPDHLLLDNKAIPVAITSPAQQEAAYNNQREVEQIMDQFSYEAQKYLNPSSKL